MPTIPLTSGNDILWVGEGPKVRANNGPSLSWNDQAYDGLAGFDTFVVNESSTKFSYFTVSMSNDAVVTLTAASGSGSKSVSIANFEKISFWDVTMYLGSAGNDKLTGTTSVESIYGFDGNDTIDGGSGTDKMFGGRGNDTYAVDSQSEIVTEKSGEGTDTVQSAVSYSLADTDGGGVNGDNIENLELTGSAKINGTGNALDNVLIGNSGVNILTGGLGNDTYVVNLTADTVKEIASGGKDLVKSSASFTLSANVEDLTLTGTAAIDGTGNSADNLIVGNKAANVITGGQGRDVMKGGAAADTFDFNSVKETLATAAHDLINDFKHLADHIDLSTIDADTTVAGNQSFSFLDVLGSEFSGSAGELRFVADGQNIIIEGNVDNDLAAEFQIELTGKIGLTMDDFIL